MSEELIRIHEVPVWTIVPFLIVLAGVLTWTVNWILKHPKPE